MTVTTPILIVYRRVTDGQSTSTHNAQDSTTSSSVWSAEGQL